MKKILILFFAGTLLASCKPNSNKKQQTAGVTTQEYTLNGMTREGAGIAVGLFLNDKFSYQSNTSIWFDADFIKSIKKTLSNDNADGLRIYFAKKVTDEANTLVMVSTKDNGISALDSKVHRHKDYFQNSAINLNDGSGLESYIYSKGYNLFLNPDRAPCKGNCDIDQHHIDCDTAYNRIKNFKGGRMPHKSLWYDTTLVDKILEDFKKIGNNADGVRVYFSRDGHKNGLVFVITVQDPNNKKLHIDYAECPIAPKLYDFNQSNIALDRGEECPIYCDDTTWN